MTFLKKLLSEHQQNARWANVHLASGVNCKSAYEFLHTKQIVK